MGRIFIAGAFVIGMMMLASTGRARAETTAEPYRILKKVKVGGEGGYDYIFADVQGRRLYVPRSGPEGHLTVFNLDTLASVGTLEELKAGGATVDPKSHHGFSTTTPITMWDSNTLEVLKRIQIGGSPDGILFDPYNERIWVMGHVPPYATVIDAKDGLVVGTLDLGGRPEQAVSDGNGTIYVNIGEKAKISVVDAKTLTVRTEYKLGSGVSGGSGLALDQQNHILFAYYCLPAPTALIVDAENGRTITTVPTGPGWVDTVAFNPTTMEAISADTRGGMTFIKETSPISFVVEQTVHTSTFAKALALDTRTNHVFTMAPKFKPPLPNAPPPQFPPAVGPVVPGSFTILMVGK